jgi:hypothetical protein
LTLRTVVSCATVSGRKFLPTSWAVHSARAVFTVRQLVLSGHIQVVSHGARLIHGDSRGAVMTDRTDVSCGVVCRGGAVSLEHAVVA